MPKATTQTGMRSTFPHQVFRRSPEQTVGPSDYLRSLKQHGRLVHELVHESLVQQQATTRNLARRLEAFPLLDHSPFAACQPIDRIDKANAIAGDRWLGCLALAVWLYRHLLSVHQENGLSHDTTERAFGQLLLYAFAAEWMTRIQDTGNPQSAWVFSLLLCGCIPTDLEHVRVGKKSWQIDNRHQIETLLPLFNLEAHSPAGQSFLTHQLMTLCRVTKYLPAEFRSEHMQPLVEAQTVSPLNSHLEPRITEQFAKLALNCQRMSSAIDQMVTT